MNFARHAGDLDQACGVQRAVSKRGCVQRAASKTTLGAEECQQEGVMSQGVTARGCDEVMSVSKRL